MKKLIQSIIIVCLSLPNVEAQQLKRWTLASQGSQKVVTPYRASWTAAGCPTCGTLQASDNKSILRQGFQQAPDLYNNPPGCLVTARFNVSQLHSNICGTKLDFEYDGTATQGVTYEWDLGEGAVPKISKDANPLGVYYITPGTKIIVLTVKQGECTKSSAKIVTINQNQVGFGGSLSITNVLCKNAATGAINLTTFGGSGVKSFKWSNGATTPNLNSLTKGAYRVTVTDGNSCSFSLDADIEEPASTMSFEETIINETCKDYNDGSILLRASGGTPPYKYTWSNNLERNTISDLTAGKYKVRISDSNSCFIDTIFEIKVRCRDNKSNKIFDTFTPNGDNLNETWIVKDIEKYPKNELIIYNRWGQVVYNKSPYMNEWVGTTNNNKELPTAAYYYVLKLNDDKGTIWTGSVTLIR